MPASSRSCIGGGADGNSYSHRPGRSGPRSAALSGRYSRRPAAGATSALEISPAARPPLHRHEEAPGRDAMPPGCAAQTWPIAGTRANPSRLSCGRSMKPSGACGRSIHELRDSPHPRAAARRALKRLRCFRGIDDLTALTIAAELGDARRFPSAPRVMAFTGLVPSEIPAAPNRRAAGSRKPAMRICGACSSSPPGTTGIIPFSAGPSPAPARCARGDHRAGLARQHRLHRRYRRLAGARQAEHSTSSPPSRANSPASCGRR